MKAIATVCQQQIIRARYEWFYCGGDALVIRLMPYVHVAWTVARQRPKNSPKARPLITPLTYLPVTDERPHDNNQFSLSPFLSYKMPCDLNIETNF